MIRFLFVSLTCLFLNLNGTIYLVIFPLLAKEKNISVAVIGFIMAQRFFGSSILLFIINYFYNFNPYKAIFVNNLIYQLIFVVFGSTYFINNNTLFSIASATSLFFLGIIGSVNYTLCYGMVGIIYADDMEKKKRNYSIGKFIGNSGSLFGIAISGLLYKYFGYFYTFNIATLVFFAFNLIFFLIMKKEKINITPTVGKQKNETFKTIDIITDFKIMASFFFLLLGRGISFYYRPGFPINLKNEFNMEESVISLYYSLYGFGLTITNFIQIFIINYFKETTFLSVSFIFGIIGMIFIGPSTIIGLPPNIIFIVSALLFLGFGRSFINNPAFHFYYKVLKNHDKLDYDDNTCNLISSSLAESITSFAGAFGPIIGGLVTTYFSFNDGMFYISLFYLLIFACFLIFIKMIRIDSKDNQNLKILKKQLI